MDEHELNLVRIAIRSLRQENGEKNSRKKKKKKKKKIGGGSSSGTELAQEEIAIEKPSKIKTRFPQLVAKTW